MDTKFHVECVYITNLKLKIIFQSFFYHCLSCTQGRGWAGTLPGYFWAKAGFHPGRVSSSSTDPHKETNNNSSHSKMLSHLAYRSLGREPVHTQKDHAAVHR